MQKGIHFQSRGIQSRFTDLKTSDPSKLRDCLINDHFFLGHLGASRTPLSTHECRGMFVGTPGMIAVRYQSRFRGFVGACAPSDDLARSSRQRGAPGILREPVNRIPARAGQGANPGNPAET